MTRDVLVSITGARFSEHDKEDVEMIIGGDYFWKNGKHYVLYYKDLGCLLYPPSRPRERPISPMPSSSFKKKKTKARSKSAIAISVTATQ